MLSNHQPKRGVRLVPVLGGLVMFPMCRVCIKDLGGERVAVLEAERLVQEYLAKEPAFQRRPTAVEELRGMVDRATDIPAMVGQFEAEVNPC